jgi:hypothetical protein
MAEMGTGALPRAEFVRWPFYYGWVSVGMAALAMVGTLPGRTQGLGLVTEPLLRDLSMDRVGFDPRTYYRTLVITALFALVGNFAAGALASRGSLRRLLVAAMCLLTASLAALPHVSTQAQVMAYAAPGRPA